MYSHINFKTKKALKEAVKKGETVRVYDPGLMGRTPTEGTVFLEGPHYPEPHRWYAECQLKDGKIISVK